MPSIETNNNWMELMASEGREVIDLEAKYNRLLQYHSLNVKTGDIKRGIEISAFYQPFTILHYQSHILAPGYMAN